MDSKSQNPRRNNVTPYFKLCECGKEYARGLFYRYDVNCECGLNFSVPPTRMIHKKHKLSALQIARKEVSNAS